MLLGLQFRCATVELFRAFGHRARPRERWKHLRRNPSPGAFLRGEVQRSAVAECVALRELCALVNDDAPLYPGTPLHLHSEVPMLQE